MLQFEMIRFLIYGSSKLTVKFYRFSNVLLITILQVVSVFALSKKQLPRAVFV